MALTMDQWAKLVQKNRAKAITVPWTEEEVKALQAGVSAEDIRSGAWPKKVEAPKEVVSAPVEEKVVPAPKKVARPKKK